MNIVSKAFLGNPLFLIGKISLVVSLIFYSVYIYINARNDWYADVFILILLFVSLPRLLKEKSPDQYCEKYDYIFLMLLGYLGLALASILFPPTQYVSKDWLVTSFFRITSVALIVRSLRPQDDYDLKIVYRLLVPFCMVMATITLLVTKGFIAKEVLGFLSPWPVIGGVGNNKYWGFYLLFLMWTAVALLWRKSLLKSVLSVVMVVLVTLALALSTSESSVLAVLGGVVVFLLAHVPVKKGRYWLYLFVFLLFLIIPLLWVTFCPVMKENPWVVFRDTSSLLSKYWSIGSRLFLYDFCADLVKKEFLFGYGFGSTLSIPIPTNVLPGRDFMPGGHPHNIVFLLFVEHGLAGFLWLVAMATMLFNHLYKMTFKSKAGPAVWALAIAGQIVFSLSFSIWHPDVVLTYGIFFILLIISAGEAARTSL